MTVTYQANVPVPTYRIGFAAQPLDPLFGIVWTDITTFTHSDGLDRLRVLSRNSTAGTQHELSKVEASVGRYVLDNRDGAFNPMNTASPYYPNVKTGVIFQERQTWGGIIRNVFTGFIEDYALQWDNEGLSQVAINCVDAFKWLNLDKLDESAWRIEVRKDVSANVAAGRNTAWLRLNESQSAEVATDYSGMGFDGTYQQGPFLGQPPIIAGDTDTSMDVAAEADSRASLPYKHLITGFPFTFECVFRAFANREYTRMIVAAFDGPVVFRQMFEVFIQSVHGSPSDVGKIIALVASPYPTGTQSESTITVDDGEVHHLAIVMSASNSLRIWVDGVDVTLQTHTGSFAFPNDLVSGYAIGNSPAVNFGDYGFDAGAQEDDEGNLVLGGIQSAVFYDGLALSSTRIAAHSLAARTGWGAESTEARIGRILDAIGWAPADRDLNVGNVDVVAGVPGGTGLAHVDIVTETEGGRFYISPGGLATFRSRTYPILNVRATVSRATFTDDGTPDTIPYVPPFDPHLDDLDTWTRASVARINGPPQVYDATPGSNATRTLTKTGLLFAEDRDARHMAQYLANLYRTSRVRVRTLAFMPQKSPTLGWPAALDLRQWDRITVKRTPAGGGAAWISDWIIEGIEHDWSSGATYWETRLSLSPADPARYFVIGSSLIGSSDVLFY
jgi:hypothetical protein